MTPLPLTTKHIHVVVFCMLSQFIYPGFGMMIVWYTLSADTFRPEYAYIVFFLSFFLSYPLPLGRDVRIPAPITYFYVIIVVLIRLTHAPPPSSWESFRDELIVTGLIFGALGIAGAYASTTKAMQEFLDMHAERRRRLEAMKR